MKDEGKKWAKGKYPSTSAGLMRRLLRRINAEIPNHRGNSTVPCFQQLVLSLYIGKYCRLKLLIN